METTTAHEPVKSDVSQAIPLEEKLKRMSKPELIKYADEYMGLVIDLALTKDAIKNELLKIDQDRQKSAREETEKSAAGSISEDDPPINVVFFNMQSANEDITFNFTGPKGMYGPENSNGHRKCPRYHLFPGMEIELPYSVVSHLRGLTFTRGKPIWDPDTGLQKGTIPIITPRFILEQRLTKDEAILLQKMRKNE